MGRLKNWFNRDVDKHLAREICDMLNQKTRHLNQEQRLAVYKKFLQESDQDEQFMRILVNEHKDHLPRIEGKKEDGTLLS